MNNFKIPADMNGYITYNAKASEDGMETKQDRVKKVNELINVIGDCGRHFFY